MNEEFGENEIPLLSEETGKEPVKASDNEKSGPDKGTIVAISLAAVLLIAALITGIIYLASNADTAVVVRDIFIILLALEFMVIGFALVILLIQLAKLINLIQNELQPILESTNETANTLRGTAIFLSDNLTEPVMKLNSYLAGIQKIVSLLNFRK